MLSSGSPKAIFSYWFWKAIAVSYIWIRIELYLSGSEEKRLTKFRAFSTKVVFDTAKGRCTVLRSKWLTWLIWNSKSNDPTNLLTVPVNLLHRCHIQWLPSALSFFCLIYHVIRFKSRVLFVKSFTGLASEIFFCVKDKQSHWWFWAHGFWKLYYCYQSGEKVLMVLMPFKHIYLSLLDVPHFMLNCIGIFMWL